MRRLPRCRLALPLAALVLGLAFPAVPSGAASDDDRRAELRHLIEEAGQEEAAALKELAQIQDHKAAVDAKVRALDRQLSDARVQLELREAEVGELAAEYTLVLAH